jgi:hypothetical protein
LLFRVIFFFSVPDVRLASAPPGKGFFSVSLREPEPEAGDLVELPEPETDVFLESDPERDSDPDFPAGLVELSDLSPEPDLEELAEVLLDGEGEGFGLSLSLSESLSVAGLSGAGLGEGEASESLDSF